MRLISVDLDTKKFGREIDLFLNFTGRKYWKKLIEKIDATDGIFYKNYLLKRNPFINPLKQYFHLCYNGKSIWKTRSPEIYYLAQKAFVINRIINNVSDSAKRQIKGRLTSDDIRSILFEIKIITHFLRNDFNAEFVEYERTTNQGRIFDFLVTRNDIESEIECKWKSYDAGRKIRRAGFYMFCDELMRQLRQYKTKCLIELNCTNNLGQNQSIFREIVNDIKFAIDSKKDQINFKNTLSISVRYLPEDLIIDSDEKFKSIIEPYRTHGSHFAVVSNNDVTFVIKVESEENDKVLKTIYDELKSSLNQFSTKRPGLIACNIEGIYPEQWEELKGETGLTVMTRHLLNKENANHIHTVSYTSEIETIVAGNITDYSSPALFFKNPNCSFHAGEDIYSLTSDKYHTFS
ncbi:MAG: hypothetical protein HY808_03895 [Nitrospirae bacterium]|nr:hypothetical protein [Nitrospirota bacterium]